MSMHERVLTTPKGEELVVLSREEYEDLVDARDHALAMAAYARGTDPGLTEAEMDEYLAAPTPLAYWRKRRGLSQTALAAAAGISQPYLAQLETGRRKSADIAVYVRLARRLGVQVEDAITPND
jgi:DNA-binding XRE family transcriptional regulator